MTLAIRPEKLSRRRSPHARLFGTDELTRGTHCAIIVAHPADEIVGAGCLISKLVDVSILHVTDGVTVDNECGTPSEKRKASAKLLSRQCADALAIAHVPCDNIFDLLVPDRCAAEYLVSVTRRITSFLQQCHADIVITHPYDGGHPDHDATAFATHAALRLMKENGLRPPVVFEMGLYPSKDQETRVAGFLPGAEGEVTTLILDERARKLKARMFSCLDSDSGSVGVTPIDSEKFRRPAKHDFSQQPPGKLHYEDFAWSIRSNEFQTLASKALTQLFSDNNATPGHGSSLTSRSVTSARADAR